jgi:hypothetical protein
VHERRNSDKQDEGRYEKYPAGCVGQIETVGAMTEAHDDLARKENRGTHSCNGQNCAVRLDSFVALSRLV